VAAPVAQAAGVWDAGTTSFIADVPAAGIQANDILIIPVESMDTDLVAGTPNTPTNWTKIFEETQNTTVTSATTLSIFAKVATGSETDVTVDGFTNHGDGNMFVIRGASPSVADILVGTGNGANSGNGTIPGVTTPTADNLVLMVVATSRDAAADDLTFSAWTNANLAGITEWEDQTTASGLGGGIGVAYGTKANAGATGDSTVTIAVSVPWRAVHLAFKPAGATTATIGQVTETNLAQSLSRLSTTAIAAPTETNLAQALGSLSAKALGLASETNTAQALGRAKVQALARAIEVDSALALGRAKTATIGRATETNLALTITALLTAILRGRVSVGRVRRVQAQADVRRVVAKAKVKSL
jgi:hypothetical protein